MVIHIYKPFLEVLCKGFNKGFDKGFNRGLVKVYRKVLKEE
jgi:hypothetical protein